MIDRWPIIFAFLLAACSATPITNQSPQTALSPEETVRQFYDWYLHARFPNPDQESKARFEKYVTQRFFKEAMNEWDVVVFIAAQDADPTWANDFRVAEAVSKGDQARTQIALNGKKVHATLRIFLKRQNGAWKIDNVKRGTWKAAAGSDLFGANEGETVQHGVEGGLGRLGAARGLLV